MRESGGSQGFISIFLLIMALCGAVGGGVVGYALEGMLPGARLLAILAAFAAVVLAIIVRRSLGRSFPALFLAWRGATVPLPVWISSCLSVLLGGLAGHDLVEVFEVPSGLLVGFVSGILAAITLATLMILYFYEHPDRGIEF